LYSYSIDATIYCLNELNKIAPTELDKARLLIVSQCDPDCHEGFLPQPKAYWKVIGYALLMLRREKNGQRKEAMELLDRLKSTGRYTALLEPPATPSDPKDMFEPITMDWFGAIMPELGTQSGSRSEQKVREYRRRHWHLVG
jgi:hypothetical protein